MTSFSNLLISYVWSPHVLDFSVVYVRLPSFPVILITLFTIKTLTEQ